MASGRLGVMCAGLSRRKAVGALVCLLATAGGLVMPRTAGFASSSPTITTVVAAAAA